MNVKAFNAIRWTTSLVQKPNNTDPSDPKHSKQLY